MQRYRMANGDGAVAGLMMSGKRTATITHARVAKSSPKLHRDALQRGQSAMIWGREGAGGLELGRAFRIHDDEVKNMTTVKTNETFLEL